MAILRKSYLSWASGEIGRHAAFRALWPQGREGSSPSSPTIRELIGFLEKDLGSRPWGGRRIFSPRNRCEPKISLAQTFFAKRSESEAILSKD